MTKAPDPAQGSPAVPAVTSLSLMLFLTSSILRCMRDAWRISSFIPPRNCMGPRLCREAVRAATGEGSAPILFPRLTGS